MIGEYKKLLYLHYFNKNEEKYNEQISIFKEKFIIGRTLRAGYPVITKEDGTYEPDWKYMENYIKSLPYGDRI